MIALLTKKTVRPSQYGVDVEYYKLGKDGQLLTTARFQCDLKFKDYTRINVPTKIKVDVRRKYCCKISTLKNYLKKDENI